VELLRRINRLESLVSKIDAEGLRETHGEEPRNVGKIANARVSTSSLGNIGNEGARRDSLDEKYATFIKQQETATPYLSGDFWARLCGEVDGLRQLLEDAPDEEDDVDDSTSNSTETKHSSPNFVLNEPATSSDSDPVYPSNHHLSILFQIYFANVDPVCKILHKPTAMAYLARAKDLLDENTGRFKFASIEAIIFAIYFAAITTLTASDCLNYFSEEKNVLVARYKRSTEVALSRADFMNSMEIVTLQAFTLYMVRIPRSAIANMREVLCPVSVVDDGYRSSFNLLFHC
jgi:hypothetical protein